MDVVFFTRQSRDFKRNAGGGQMKNEDKSAASIVINGSQKNGMRTPFPKACTDVLTDH
jgi:hypothetical protein